MITVGIDEVGRGCWAGPLVAGAVVLSRPIAGLKDSKKLSKAERQRLAGIIESEALAIGLGWVDAATIDRVGITIAVKLAMERALAQIAINYNEVIIDGNFNYFAGNPKARTIVRADSSVPGVSAASIVAKVARDTYMTHLSEQYAGFGFANHVGYGTAAHLAALQTLGVSDIHRRSFKPIQALIQAQAR